MTIGIVDLQRQREALEPGLSAAIARVIESGRFVNGPEVAELEALLARRVGVAHVIACANGTDALQLMLRAREIGPGDAVFVPALTFAATAEAVMLTGATPVFVDIDAATGTMCPHSLSRAVASVLSEGRLAPRAALPVDLFSIPADHAGLAQVCDEAGLTLFYDAAHSIGTETGLGHCGALGAAAATSFYPSKAIGCFGDGGAVFTNDAGIALAVRCVANHGVGAATRAHEMVGTNSRRDTIQAAVLLEKMKVFDAETATRRAIAEKYRAAFADCCELPQVATGTQPVWSYFVIRHPERDRLSAALVGAGIQPVAYYRDTLDRQPAFNGCPTVPGGLPNTALWAESLLCLPLHPYLTEDETDRVVAAVRGFS